MASSKIKGRVAHCEGVIFLLISNLFRSVQLHLTDFEVGIHRVLRHTFMAKTSYTSAGGECRELNLIQNIAQRPTELQRPYLISPGVILWALVLK